MALGAIYWANIGAVFRAETMLLNCHPDRSGLRRQGRAGRRVHLLGRRGGRGEAGDDRSRGGSESGGI